MDDVTHLSEQYLSAVRSYLEDGGEEALSLAYETGRKALLEGRSVAEIAVIHHQALAQVRDKLHNHDETRLATLLVECLAPFVSRFHGIEGTQDALRAAEEHFALLVHGTTEYAIFMLDTEGLIVSWNPGAERIYGYTANDVLGQHVALLYPPEDVELGIPEEGLRSAAASGRFEEQTWKVRSDGSRFMSNSVVSSLTDGSGHLRGFARITRDVTDRHRAEKEKAELQERLSQSERLESLGRLAGGIAHDFNNLLAVILNYAEFSKENAEEMIAHLHESEAARQLVHDISQITAAAEQAARLTKQLLIFSRRESASPEIVDLNSIVGGMEAMLTRTIGEDILLQVALAPSLANVRVDRSQIEQVIVNLVVNARDAMPHGGTLEISTSDIGSDEAHAEQSGIAPGNYVILTVSDSGQGMDKENAARAFEPFFTTKGPGGGTGLGLATVYGVVSNAGGNVHLYSEPGIGTTFKIYLPATGAVAESPAEPITTSLSHGDQRVLLVEDEEAVRTVTQRILVEAGYDVLPAASPQEALDLLAQYGEDIDAVVTDIIMPGMSGITLGSRIRESHPKARILYLSGYSPEIIAHRGVLQSDVMMLEKPFTRAALLRKLRETFAD